MQAPLQREGGKKEGEREEEEEEGDGDGRERLTEERKKPSLVQIEEDLAIFLGPPFPHIEVAEVSSFESQESGSPWSDLGE